MSYDKIIKYLIILAFGGFLISLFCDYTETKKSLALKKQELLTLNEQVKAQNAAIDALALSKEKAEQKLQKLNSSLKDKYKKPQNLDTCEAQLAALKGFSDAFFSRHN